MYAYPHMTGSWPTPGGSSYTLSSSANHAQNSLQQAHYGGSRPLFSPSMQQYPGRTAHSPATDGLPPPQYGQELPPFGRHLSGNSSSHTSMSSQPSSTQPLPTSILASQSPAAQAPTSSSAPGESYMPPTTSSYAYPPSSTPQQQATFSAYSQPSPTQASPTTSGSANRSLSSMAPPLGYGGGRPTGPGPAYSYHHVAGPIMSNMGNPGGQMSLVSGGVGGVSPMSMPGYSPHGQSHGMPHVYSHGPNAPQGDRPFKCDTCPQSFNRNHDLKRHKRIHLAVKPYPCNHCDKSFSRKDALKVSQFWSVGGHYCIVAP